MSLAFAGASATIEDRRTPPQPQLQSMSRQNRVVLKIREMILSGTLRPGERVAEIPIAAQLGVSRTPVRYALGVLAREGLVAPTDNRRGFIVREFSLKDIVDAIQVRGQLEGMAARLVAEAGLRPELDEELEACVEEGKRIFAKRFLDGDDGTAWADLNERFHDLLVLASGNRPLIQALHINNEVPFASARAFLDDSQDAELLRRQYDVLYVAQHQHETILHALRNRESARVEALMREHSYVAVENILLFKTALPHRTPAFLAEEPEEVEDL